MANPLRVFVVGAGQIAAEVHLPILSQMGEINVVGIHDVSKERAEKLASRFGIRRVYANLDELKSTDVDVLDICTPPQSHEQLVVESLENGINCIVEKPFSVTSDECDNMVEIARRANKRLFPIQNYSFMPSMLRAKALVKTGDIGKVVNASFRYYTSFDDHRHKLFLDRDHWVHQIPGDVFSDLSTHAAFALVEIIGKPEQVRAVVKNTVGNANIVGDELLVVATAKDAVGSFLISYGSDMKMFLGEVVGTKGALRVDSNSQAVVKSRPVMNSRNTLSRGMQAASEILQLAGNLITTSTNVMIQRYSALTYGHEYLFRKCFRNIRFNEPYPISLKDVRDSISLCEEAFEQMAIGAQ